MNGTPLLEVRRLSVHYPLRRSWLRRPRAFVRAVDDVSFTLAAGETLGLVGESGCGKTTVGRALVRLVEPTSGNLLFRGREILAAEGPESMALRREIQLLFQDPWSSLDPRATAGDIVAEGIDLHRLARGEARRRRVRELLEQVGIPPEMADRRPAEFSGGQRQRLGIARAVAVDPSVLICDEAVAALDVSVQAQILDLLLDLRERRGLSCLFISHDLRRVRGFCHRVAVMHAGELVEIGPTEAVFELPRHPFTRALLASAGPTPGDEPLRGDPPSPLEPPSGCRFHPRCPEAHAGCSIEVPPEREAAGDHRYRCVIEP